MKFTEFTENNAPATPPLVEAQPATTVTGGDIGRPANNNSRPTPEQLRQQLRVINNNLTDEQRRAVTQELRRNRSLWQRLGAWGAKTAGRHAGATVSSAITGPAAPAVAAVANLALLGYDVYSLGSEIWDWAGGNDVELPPANGDNFEGTPPISAPARPTSQGGRNRNQDRWDRRYGETHNPDGSPIVITPPATAGQPQPKEEPNDAPEPANDPRPPIRIVPQEPPAQPEQPTPNPHPETPPKEEPKVIPFPNSPDVEPPATPDEKPDVEPPATPDEKPDVEPPATPDEKPETPTNPKPGPSVDPTPPAKPADDAPLVAPPVAPPVTSPLVKPGPGTVSPPAVANPPAITNPAAAAGAAASAPAVARGARRKGGKSDKKGRKGGGLAGGGGPQNPGKMMNFTPIQLRDPLSLGSVRSPFAT